MRTSTVHPGTTRVLALCGTDPLGRAALNDRWPALGFDGYLYADLHGSTPVDATPPGDVLVACLYVLGVPAERLPADLRGRTDLYRVITSNRRLLVVVDNAISTDQVRPLLPLAGVAVVTSRQHLTGLRADGVTVLAPSRRDYDGVTALLATQTGAQP